jgi:oligoribonuclease NrnB/cAMP/cGMP phosphodiesterase (DHH superfamily)
MKDRPLIIYHANCADGFCAAWVAHVVFGDDADYVPAQYGESPPDVDGRKVYIVDFSYKRPVMRRILSEAHSVVVLDHHKTAQSELACIIDEFIMRSDLIANPPGSELPVVHFDMGKSGGRLTWEHFFPGKPSSWLVDYTEDRDLWLWRLNWSKEISAFLGSMPRTFEAWNRLDPLGPGSEKWDTYVDQGTAILRYQDQLIEAISKTAREIELGDHKILAANTSCLFSEVAGKLAEGRPFGAAWFQRSDNLYQYSLRSTTDGIDVSEVARHYGGGGHRGAAGFQINSHF